VLVSLIKWKILKIEKEHILPHIFLLSHTHIITSRCTPRHSVSPYSHLSIGHRNGESAFFCSINEWYAKFAVIQPSIKPKFLYTPDMKVKKLICILGYLVHPTIKSLTSWNLFPPNLANVGHFFHAKSPAWAPHCFTLSVMMNCFLKKDIHFILIHILGRERCLGFRV
jgi:hypothetical protein